MIMDIEGLCRKLKPIIGIKADELWYMWLSSDLQERKNLEIEIQIIAEKALKHGPLQDKVILLPPPEEEQAKGDFILGKVIYRDKKLFPIYLKDEDFVKQVGIFSITGGGKTNTAMLLAAQLLKNEGGKSPIPFMVVDWKRQWRSMLSLENFPEMKNVRVYTIGRDVIPFLWNPFRPPPNIDYKTWISVIIECLEKSHLAGPGVGDFIIRIYEKLFKEIDIKKEDFYPNFHDGLRELSEIKVGGREFLWWQSTKRIFNNFIFGPASKSFNTRNPIKLEELLEKPVILELDQEMPKPLRIFFMEMIIRFVHLYRLGQGDSDNALRHVLFLEEIHNLFQKTSYEKDRLDSLENVYREMRSFGQGLVSITQHPSLLPTYILGNSRTLIFLALQHQDDVEAARKAIFLPRDDEVYLNMLKTGQGITKIMERINPCLVQFLYVPVIKGKITDDWLRVNTPGYLLPASDTEEEEEPGYLQADNIEPEKNKYPVESSGVNKLLIDIHLHPLLGTTQRYKKLGINARYGNEYKNLLISEGLIQPRQIITNSGWIMLFELTPKGRLTLKDLGYEAKDDKESVEHKFWKYKIGEYYKNKGFNVLVEEHINGSPDIIVINGNIKAAVEIETGNSDFIKNIERDSKLFDNVICVATDKEVERKIIENLGETNERVKIVSALSFSI